jgi:hypothetical protein
MPRLSIILRTGKLVNIPPDMQYSPGGREGIEKMGRKVAVGAKIRLTSHFNMIDYGSLV